jgi:hypothetical protein
MKPAKQFGIELVGESLPKVGADPLINPAEKNYGYKAVRLWRPQSARDF